MTGRAYLYEIRDRSGSKSLGPMDEALEAVFRLPHAKDALKAQIGTSALLAESPHLPGIALTFATSDAGPLREATGGSFWARTFLWSEPSDRGLG
ncbi:MAG: hypothetical protein IPO97_12200 [Sphingomonadales bacterium]|nr:hypothetical protein [Sphingomonadales bacterium]